MIRYDIDADNKTVTAIIYACQYDVTHYIERRIKQVYPNSAVALPYEMWYKCLLNDEYRGTVKCIAPDTFNIKTGKRLAREKAIQHYDKAFSKRLDIYTATLLSLDFKILTDWQNNKFTNQGR